MRAVKDNLVPPWRICEESEGELPSNTGGGRPKRKGGRSGDSLCSRNARPQKPLVGRAHIGMGQAQTKKNHNVPVFFACDLLWLQEVFVCLIGCRGVACGGIEPLTGAMMGNIIGRTID